MIRPARFTDQPAIERLIRGQHSASKYAGRVGIADKALEALVLGMIAQAGQNGPQGSHVAVAVRDGKVTGFVAGVLDRVYHVGDRLTANDLFLVNSGSLADTLGLVDSYVGWARSNPRVIEIMLSWSDALPGAEGIAALARRKGFVKSGEMFEMRLDVPAMAEQAGEKAA